MIYTDKAKEWLKQVEWLDPDSPGGDWFVRGATSFAKFLDEREEVPATCEHNVSLALRCKKCDLVRYEPEPRKEDKPVCGNDDCLDCPTNPSACQPKPELIDEKPKECEHKCGVCNQTCNGKCGGGGWLHLCVESRPQKIEELPESYTEGGLGFIKYHPTQKELTDKLNEVVRALNSLINT